MLFRSSSLWSQFRDKYKQGQTEPHVEGDDKMATGIVDADLPSYIAKQSAAAASAYLSGPHKKRRVRRPTEGDLALAKGEGGSSSVRMSSEPRLDHVPKFVKNERSALSALQDTLLGRY